jgi:uncharacterized membrane protein (UPF0127 family)/predicted small lipoprotein YifL
VRAVSEVLALAANTVGIACGIAVASLASCGNRVTAQTPPQEVAAAAPAPSATDKDRKNDKTDKTGESYAVIAEPDGKPPAKVRVSLARSDEQRRRGLMYVQNLPPDDGMLFIFDSDAEQSFWMKNTVIPLDMIFIRSDMTVAGVIADAKPLTLEPRSVGRPSRFVLEVNGGWARQHGVTTDTKMRFENIRL